MARRVFILGGGEPLLAKEITPAIMAGRVKQLGLEGIPSPPTARCFLALMDQVLDDGWDELHFSIDGADAETTTPYAASKGRSNERSPTPAAAGAWRAPGASTARASPLHTVITRKNHHQLAAIVRLADALGAFRGF
ncbi:MAG: hypothetical protein IPN01_38585 [Deltaproteobacteria bacterium]|nr:hypothetical protein [Deltaproteobacteria bacterium]